MTENNYINQIKGAMTASAIGGALGNPEGLITDDTQMALFTAEGLILSRVRSEYTGDDLAEPVFHSLLRWLTTQQVHMLGDMIKAYGSCSIVDGILMGHQELFAFRNPSDTCLKVLTKGTMGTLQYPPNTEKGPGALVRTLPVGLAFSDAQKAFDTGCETAAITHGHADAILSSGLFAALISQVIAGQPLSWALTASLNLLKTKQNHAVLLDTLEKAVSLSASADPVPNTIETHFGDKTAANTLAAGLFSALCHPKDLNRGLLLSVNHAGNISETGAVTGAILGALQGIKAVPGQFLDNLELKDVILELARDLYDQFYKQNG